MHCCNGSAYSRQQWIILVLSGMGQFCTATIYGIQAPLYPIEAEKKGATPTQYSFVFGVLMLTIFLVSPVCGWCMGRWKPRTITKVGIFTESIAVISFGFLNRLEDTTAFIGFSFALRIMEGIGCAAYVTSNFSIIAEEFPGYFGRVFGVLETCFGVGTIVGPTIGGALYEVGGYTLPFITIGGFMLVTAIFTSCFLPSASHSSGEEVQNRRQILSALRLPSIQFISFAIIVGTIGVGYLEATLEPHLRPLKLSPFKIGLLFMLIGFMFAITAPVWGWLNDKYLNPKVITAAGSLLSMVAFMLIGPMPFLPFHMTLGLCIGAIILHGAGVQAVMVSTFADAHRSVLANGFPDDVGTYMIVSSIYISSYALGCFVGPSLGGVLFDLIGFDWGTVSVATLQLLVVLCVAIDISCKTVRGFSSHGTDARQNRRGSMYQESGSGDSTYGSTEASEEVVHRIE